MKTSMIGDKWYKGCLSIILYYKWNGKVKSGGGGFTRVEKLILKFIRYLGVFKNVLKETHRF